jgi:uncharacterized membrane protein
MNPVTVSIIQTVVRNLLQLVCGSVLASGVASKDSLEAIVGGITSAIVLGWGIYHQKQHAAEKEAIKNEKPLGT